jgi:hypothetical protein
VGWGLVLGSLSGVVVGALVDPWKGFVQELGVGSLQARRKKEQDAGARADEAAVLCYQALGQLQKLLPDHLRERRSRKVDEDAHRESRNKIAAELSALEQNLLLLPVDVRERIRAAHTILSEVEDLTDRGPYSIGPYHPDSGWSMTHATINDARAALAAFRRHEPIPEESQSVYEYRLAHDELMDDRNNEFAEEIHEADQQIEAWRARRGVTGKERGTSV